MVDPLGVTGNSDPVKRQLRTLRLLIAVRDQNASDTGWVFGTFAWMGPKTGDGFFDNMVPVGLMWGNDPTEYGTNIAQSIVNLALKGTLYGRPGRDWMGFQGRMNGPADNKFSSCLSCHGASQLPRSARLGLVVNGDVAPDATSVRKHVDDYFRNIKAGELFDATMPNAVALDYSLQIEAGFFRMCLACQSGALAGKTPQLCFLNPRFNTLGPNCNNKPSAGSAPLPLSMIDEPLPRQ